MAVTDFTPVGARFGLLTVVGRPFKKEGKQHHYHVHCKCDCGGEKTVQCYNLTKGYTTSCGCEHRRMLERRNTKHGMCGTRTYCSWQAMLKRCLNPKEPAYPNYGGRGIKVCDRWRDSFENFLADMGECPPRMSIERDRVNGDYEPGNCRWATDMEQANNKRNTIFFLFNGKMKTAAQIAREVGIKYQTFRDRIERGWSVERAANTPVRQFA